MPAPPFKRSKATSLRSEDMQDLARLRAKDMLPEADDETVEAWAEMLEASDAMAEFGAASSTLDKDDQVWPKWCDFCILWGWSPLITVQEATERPDLVSQKLSTFMLWVYPQIKGRHKPQAKARSALAYPLAVMRVFRRRKVPMPKAKAFQSELDGLLKMYRSVHGAVANAPNRKHPFLPEYWNKIDALKDGQALAGRPAWSPTTRRLDRVMLRMGRVMRRTANRAREFLEGRDKDQISWMTRASATYRLSGVIVTDPTPAQLAPEKRRVGDLVYLVMPHTKADKTGERNCPFPCILPYDGTSSCAAAGIMDQELEEPCHGRDQRERGP